MFSSATRVLLLASFILASPRAMACGETAPLESHPAAGPLKVHPANPRYFTDGSGRAVYLTGSHTWYSLQDSGPKGKPATPFDYPRYLDLLVARGHNFMRIWAYEGGENESFYEPLPYLRSGPGQALDGKPKFDVSKFDPAYFDRMRSRIVAAQDRGIYVGVMLFQGWSLYDHGHGNPWPLHPFNRENNVNGIDGDPDRDGEGKEVQTLAIPAITQLQQAYLRKVIDTVGDLDNVLYEITNESPMQSKEWQYHMIRAIHGYEATKPKRHPVGMTFFDSGGAGAMEALLASPADWISPGNSGSADYFKDPPAADGRKVILNDTDHHASTSSEASWPWRCFFRGQNPICMDGYDGDRWEPIRRAMGETRRLAERVDLAAMSPHVELVSTAYCLATPGKEYLVYLPEGGTVEVDLSEATGDLAEEWIETATGKQFPAADPPRLPRQATAGAPPGGSRRKCTAPFPSEAVLHLSPLAAAPRDMTVYGRAPVGAFGVNTVEHVEGAAKLGMTLIYSYSPESARKQLDLSDPMGQAVSKHKMQVMYPLCGRFTQVRLAREIGPADTTIPVAGERADSVRSFPESGYLMVEGERIEYASRTDGAFVGCRRGTGGTRAASHGVGLLLCDSEALRKEILAVKDAPGLWGWWLVDDNRPREIDSLREMSRIIRLADRDAHDRPNHHIIVMGIGGSSAMANFDAGICDALGVYPYPYHHGKLDVTTRNQMQFIMTRARSLQPDIGLIGIYQAFGCGETMDSPQWKDMPTPEQVREDMLSFYDWGADGVMAFIYHWRGTNPKEPQGLDAVPVVRDMIGRTNEEILAGKVKRTVPPAGKREWLTILAGPEAKTTPGGKPAYDLDDPAKLASLVKGRPDRLSAEAFSAQGRSYPLRVKFPAWNKNDPRSDRWPIAQFAAGDLTATDWSQVRALEQPIYNPGEETITVLISLEDAAKGWWQRTVEIAPRVPMLLRVPMDEARLSVDPARIQRWLLWESDPPAPVEFRLGTPMLAPAGDLPYTTYTSFDQVLEGRDARYAVLTRVSDPGTDAHRMYTGFFFYQVLQFDASGRYLLGQRVYFENRETRADDGGDIGTIDLEDGNKWTKIGETTAWNWQQGARLQWRPRSVEIVWNDRSDDGKSFVCRIYNFRTGARRTLPRPVYDISPDGTTALTHDFERMRLFHGTEYVGIEDRYEKEFAPGQTGIWKMDMETGKAEMVLSLERMAAIAYPKGLPPSGHLYFFREGWNPSGTRFVAFIKDPANGLFDAYSVAPDGTDVRYLYHNPSHHSWRDDRHILDFGHHAPPGGGSPQGGYFLFADDGSGKAKEVLWPSNHDGHDSYVPGPGGDWILSDTYVLAGYQYLFLFHVPSRLFVPLARLKSTADDVICDGSCRVDLHPRLSRDGRKVSIDATHEGRGRQMYVLDIGHILDHPPARR